MHVQSDSSHHSKANAAGMTVMILTSLVSALFAGAAIAVIQIHSPSGKLQAVSPSLLGALGGLGVLLGAYWGKVTSEKARICVAVPTGFFLLGFAWFMYLNLFSWERSGTTELVYQPAELWTLLTELNALGLGEVSRRPINGKALSAIWILMSSVMLILYLIASLSFSLPFCEKCGKWTRKTQDSTVFRFDVGDQLQRRFKEEGVAVLDRLKIAGPETRNLIKLTLHQCPTCSDSNYLTISSLHKETGKKESETPAHELIKKVPVSREVVEKIQKLIQIRKMMVTSQGGQTSS